MTHPGPRLHVPQHARAGDIVRVRAKIPHPMETGWRKDIHGDAVPRNRIHTFVCMFEKQEIFGADLHSGIAKDPYLSFFMRVERSGTLTATWKADDGATFTAQAEIEVA